eukprot:gene11327-17413_t
MSTPRKSKLMTNAERQRLVQKIHAAEQLKERKTTPSLGSRPDSNITAFVPGKRTKTMPGGGTTSRGKGDKNRETVVIRRADGGNKAEVLTLPWTGAPQVTVTRSSAVCGSHAVVPAYIPNGEIVTVLEKPGWQLLHKEYVRIERKGKERCEGYVQKIHVVPTTLTQHTQRWQDPKPKEKGIIKDSREPPTRTLIWEWAGKTLSCPVKLTGARDLDDGTVVAAPPTYVDKKHTHDITAGFHPLAPPDC